MRAKHFTWRHWLWALLWVLIATGTGSSTPQRSGGNDEAQFQAAMDEIQRTMEHGDFTRAKRRLNEVLSAHAERDYVFGRRHEIVEELQRCEFWSTHRRPEPRDVLSAEVQAFDREKGTISLCWKRGSKGSAPRSSDAVKPAWNCAAPPEFAESKGVFLLPMRFNGSHVVELTIDGERSHNLDLYVCCNRNGCARSEPCADSSCGVTCKIKAVVTSREITVYHNGRVVDARQKSPDEFGCFGFTRGAQVQRIAVSGKVETAWIDGLIDAEVERQRTEFNQHFDVADCLPTWLRAVSAEPAPKEVSKAWTAPGPDDPKVREHAKQASKIAAEKGFVAAMDYVRAIPDIECSESVREWWLAGFSSASGRWEEALDHLDRLGALDPSWFPAHASRAMILGEVLTHEKALAEYRALVDQFPREPGAHELLANVLMVEGRPLEARRTLDAAVALGVNSRSFESVRLMLARSSDGPAWGKTFEYRSRHFRVISDISSAICFEAAQVLEQRFTKYNLHFRRAPADRGDDFVVCLFAGKQGYLNYIQGLSGAHPQNTAGVYMPRLKQLLIWNLPEREDMFRTIRHEGFHQFLDQLTHTAPVWLNEGLAEYFETSELVGGNWEDGAPNRDHMDVLTSRNAAIVPLDSFLRMGAATFYADAPLHYAEAWAFAHFLQHSGREHREQFDRLLDLLVGGLGGRAAVEEVFGAVDMAALDREFRAYVPQIGR